MTLTAQQMSTVYYQLYFPSKIEFSLLRLAGYAEISLLPEMEVEFLRYYSGNRTNSSFPVTWYQTYSNRLRTSSATTMKQAAESCSTVAGRIFFENLFLHGKRKQYSAEILVHHVQLTMALTAQKRRLSIGSIFHTNSNLDYFCLALNSTLSSWVVNS
jgi:hypothetical protein